MPASDGYFTLAVGNDPTFERFISVAQKASPGAEQLLEDERFKTAVARVGNRRRGTEIFYHLCHEKIRYEDINLR